MDRERVLRTTLPQVTVGMPLSLLKWVDEQAVAAGLSRSRWIVELIESERLRDQTADPSSSDGRDLAEIAS
jgi:hypothetical protein